MASSQTFDKSSDTWIPEGFLEVIGPDEKKYIVPEFMVPALDQAILANQKKVEKKAFEARGAVSLSIHLFS
jgi:hypothetical protein